VSGKRVLSGTTIPPSQESGILLHSMARSPQTKFRLRHISAVWSILLLVVSAGNTVPTMLGQTESPIWSTVNNGDGKPIADVKAYGSMSKSCCPFKREQTTTDKEGQFRLEHPGTVIHFWKEGLQPQALVLKRATSEVRITMVPPANTLIVRACGNAGPGQKQIGGDKYGLRFEVPTHAVKVLGGKADVDYIRYVIKPKSSEAFLELWFGPYAINTDPDDEMFVNSAKFEQRNIVTPDGGVVGKDSWGELAGGAMWRQTAVVADGGSVYRSASPQAADLFNQLVDSICEVPYPSR
jgi:hypothetical protein